MSKTAVVFALAICAILITAEESPNPKNLTSPTNKTLTKRADGLPTNNEPGFMSKLASWIFPFGGGNTNTGDSVASETHHGGGQYLPPSQNLGGYQTNEDCNPCNKEPWIPVATNYGKNTIIGFMHPSEFQQGKYQANLDKFRPPVSSGQNYGVPKLNQNYGVPNLDQKTPAQSYGIPHVSHLGVSDNYRPTSNALPADNYGPPLQSLKPPSDNYGLPFQNLKPLTDNYGPPLQNLKPPSDKYGPPLQTLKHASDNYGPPLKSLSDNYGPPFQNVKPLLDSYGSPLHNEKPVDNYGPPLQNLKPPVNNYGPPSFNGNGHNFKPPVKNYGSPNIGNHAGRNYGPANAGNIAIPSTSYGHPNLDLPLGNVGSLSGTYGPPSDNYGLPNNLITANHFRPDSVSLDISPPNGHFGKPEHFGQNHLENVDPFHTTFSPPTKTYGPPQAHPVHPKPFLNPPAKIFPSKLQNIQKPRHVYNGPREHQAPSQYNNHYRPPPAKFQQNKLKPQIPTLATNMRPPPFSPLNRIPSHDQLIRFPNSNLNPNPEYLPPRTQLPLSQDHQVHSLKPIPLPNLSLYPLAPLKGPQDFHHIVPGFNNQNHQATGFNQNQNLQTATGFNQNQNNQHSGYIGDSGDVQIQQSIAVADYVASIEHPINVVHSPIFEVNVANTTSESEFSEDGYKDLSNQPTNDYTVMPEFPTLQPGNGYTTINQGSQNNFVTLNSNGNQGSHADHIQEIHKNENNFVNLNPNVNQGSYTDQNQETHGNQNNAVESQHANQESLENQNQGSQNQGGYRDQHQGNYNQDLSGNQDSSNFNNHNSGFNLNEESHTSFSQSNFNANNFNYNQNKNLKESQNGDLNVNIYNNGNSNLNHPTENYDSANKINQNGNNLKQKANVPSFSFSEGNINNLGENSNQQSTVTADFNASHDNQNLNYHITSSENYSTIKESISNSNHHDLAGNENHNLSPSTAHQNHNYDQNFNSNQNQNVGKKGKDTANNYQNHQNRGNDDSNNFHAENLNHYEHFSTENGNHHAQFSTENLNSNEQFSTEKQNHNQENPKHYNNLSNNPIVVHDTHTAASNYNQNKTYQTANVDADLINQIIKGVDGFTKPELDYNDWLPSQELSTEMVPPSLEGQSFWLTTREQSGVEITTKKPKQIQIIIPYTTNSNPTKNVGRKVLPVHTQPPSYESVWTEHIKATTPVINIKDLLKSKNQDFNYKNLPFDIIRFQKNIDDWTVQEYANKMLLNLQNQNQHQKSTTTSKLSPSKQIPEEYLTTQPYNPHEFEVTTFSPKEFFDHEPAGSNSKEYQYKDEDQDDVDVEHNFISGSSSSTTTTEKQKSRPSWDKIQIAVSPLTKEKVYVVTPQPKVKINSSTESWRNANLSTTFSINILPMRNASDLNDVRIVLSEWPHLINNLVTTTSTSTQKPRTSRHPLFGLMDLSSYAPPGNATIQTYSGHSKVINAASSSTKKKPSGVEEKATIKTTTQKVPT